MKSSLKVLLALIARKDSLKNPFPVNDKQAIKNKVEFYRKRDRRRQDMTKIVKCPKCGEPATHHNIGGVQCCHCGHGCGKLFESSEVPATIPPGKIKTVPFKDNKPLFKNEGDSTQSELF